MKHCAKKLLGLAFALALCLAVGGTALAETPVLAEVSDTLPEQEMLDYEPYAAPATGEKTIDKFATDGYTVTIPTTVTVNSGTNTGTLPVRAQLKQWRTLNITMEPQDEKWTLKYQGAAGADTPEVTYQLPQESSGADDYSWYYQHDYNMLSFSTVGMQLGTSPEDVDNFKEFSHNLTITVPHPEQATMSGTYSDTVSFEFELEKLCVTYTINIYEQKLVLNKDGWHDNGNEHYLPVNAVNVVDETTGIAETDATPISTVTLEYPSWDGTTHTWTRTRPTSDGGEDERRWADLSYELTSKTDFDQNKITEKTINLNLKRKWYYLDVNGATDYTNEFVGGNQGDHIGSYVDIQVSVDETDWTNWFWQGDGDDYWQQLPYGIHFKLGFHHVKNGYVYEKSGKDVKLIANKQEMQTAYTTQSADNATTYYVYEGTLTGEPTDTVDGGKIRYCYVPCYKKGLTYIANDGTGGTESVNPGNPPRSNMLYDENDTLKKPEDLKIIPPTGKSFAGWSTSADYPTTGKLYQPDDPVSSVEWDNYTSAEMTTRPQGDDQKRVLYAIWRSATGPSRAPAKKALTLRYHANFDPMEELALDLDPDPLLDDMDDTFGFDPDPLPEDVDDALEEAVKTVSYQPGEDVVLRNCMFKRGGYVFVGWNTEPDGTGRLYRVNGVPITDWAAGDTVDLYAQWKKPEHLKPVVDNEPFVPTDPDTPPEWVDDVFDADFGAEPAAQPEELDDAFGVDPAAQPDALDAAFGVDPAQPEDVDDAFGVDPAAQPDELDDAFSV